MIVSICKDLTKAKKNKKLKATVDKGERVISKQRSRIEGSGGGHVHKQKVGLKTYSLTVVTDDAREALEEVGEFTLLTYEEIFGYTRQVTDEDGVPQWDQDTVDSEGYTQRNPIMETIPPVKAATDLYNKAYDRAPITDSEGNIYTPSALFSIPAGASIDHLLAV